MSDAILRHEDDTTEIFLTRALAAYFGHKDIFKPRLEDGSIDECLWLRIDAHLPFSEPCQH
jgi:hypothetical protein